MQIFDEFDTHNYILYTTYCSHKSPEQFNPLSANSTEWSNTLKQFVGYSRRIAWMCLAIFVGLAAWRVKAIGKIVHNIINVNLNYSDITTNLFSIDTVLQSIKNLRPVSAPSTEVHQAIQWIIQE